LSAFEVTQDKLLIIYSVKAAVSPEVASELVKHIAALVSAAPAAYLIVLDMQAFDMDYRCFRPFGALAAELKKLKAQVHVLTKSHELLTLLQREGMTSILKPIESLAALGPEHGCASRPKVDVNFINPFIQGVIQTLEVQCQTRAAPEKPALKDSLGLELHSDIAGVICITSPSFSGNVSVCFPEATFLLLMSRMLGEPCTELTKDLEDGASEILNMISAHGRKVLSESGLSFDRAIPTVVRGPDQGSVRGAIVLPFRVEGGTFHIEITPGKAG
jgi:chemotaxis protein CheX